MSSMIRTMRRRISRDEGMLELRSKIAEERKERNRKMRYHRVLKRRDA